MAMMASTAGPTPRKTACTQSSPWYFGVEHRDSRDDEKGRDDEGHGDGESAARAGV